METRRRTIAKVISWRTTATITTMTISFFITGNLDMALKIGVIEVVAKILFQYFHDRIWIRIPYGTNKTFMDYNI